MYNKDTAKRERAQQADNYAVVCSSAWRTDENGTNQTPLHQLYGVSPPGLSRRSSIAWNRGCNAFVGPKRSVMHWQRSGAEMPHYGRRDGQSSKFNYLFCLPLRCSCPAQEAMNRCCQRVVLQLASQLQRFAPATAGDEEGRFSTDSVRKQAGCTDRLLRGEKRPTAPPPRSLLVTSCICCRDFRG